MTLTSSLPSRLEDQATMTDDIVIEEVDLGLEIEDSLFCDGCKGCTGCKQIVVGPIGPLGG